MMVKVCGMREAQNIAEVARLEPDFMGFIFYERSPRYAGEMPPESLDVLPPETQRVGVFVNASEEYILATTHRYTLDFVQLHGAESPEMCADLRAKGLGVIKAFGIASREDVESAATYNGTCDYYIFDTASATHGGTGRKFDHTLLASYRGSTPFLLSGGLGLEDAIHLTAPHPLCVGFDINSRFETAPGIKDPEAIEQFIKTIKNRTI
jgi:phosphoribosylanthranilate isomerase